jgi:hypothetical protein
MHHVIHFITHPAQHFDAFEMEIRPAPDTDVLLHSVARCCPHPLADIQVFPMHVLLQERQFLVFKIVGYAT